MMRTRFVVVSPVAAAALLLGAAAAGAQPIRYVDGSAPAGGDGASWPSAFTSLHDALAAAPAGTEVRIAQGRYTPAPPGGDRTISFTITTGVRVLGGYAGLAGPDPDERDPAVYITILSGDLNNNDGANFTNMGDNSHNVVRTSGAVSAATLLDGLVISGGNAAAASNRLGAGLHIAAGNPTISNCTFMRNISDADFGGGGGVGSTSSQAPTFIDCRFLENRSRFPTNAARGLGGGLYASNAVLTRCAFEGNIANVGGGFYVAGFAVLNDCQFIGNTAVQGGGMFFGGSSTTASTLNNCDFRLNTAGNGGGVYIFNIHSPIAISHSRFIGNAASAPSSSFGGGLVNLSQNQRLERCLFINNTAATGGGALTTSSGTGHIINCTIANNSAGGSFSGGIMLDASNSTPSIRNTIVWDNTDASGSGEGAQIRKFFAAGANPAVNYSCIQGLTGNLGGVGNIGLDPLFNDTLNQDYTLAAGSPCLDAGDPDPVYNDPDGSRNDIGAFVGAQNARPDAVAVCQQLTSIGDSALVRLDGTGSWDPDDDFHTLTFEWTVNGVVVCSGGAASCAVIEVAMAFGSNEVTLRVTDPAGGFDQDSKSIVVDPAALALLRPTSVTVQFAEGRITMEGEIALPSTVDHREVTPVITASMDLGGEPAVPTFALDFSTAGRFGEKWTMLAADCGFTDFKVDWGGARFLFRQPGHPVRMQSDLITSSESILTVWSNPNRTGAFALQINGTVLLTVSGSGEVFANIPFAVADNGKEITLTLPFPIEATTSFTFTGGVTGTIAAADYLSSSVGRFRTEAMFDPSAYPAGASTGQRSVDLFLLVGGQNYPGTASTDSARVTVRGSTWRAN